MHRPKGLGLAVIVSMTLLVATTAHLTANPPAEPMNIGFVQSIFTDVPPTLIKQIVAPTFKRLMKDQTGLDGQLVIGGDAYDVAQKLMDGKLQLAVFHGVEFAWVQQKHKELRPLMIAVHGTRYLKAHVLVPEDSKATCFADLKGKEVALAARAKDHCRQFLAKSCRECGQCQPQHFFSQLVKPAHMEAALDAVCSGEVAAAVVDNVSLDWYRELKPGCCRRLKSIKDSEVFPAAVIVHRDGGLDDVTLAKFRDGMLNANKDRDARDVMGMFKIDAFEPIPDDYPQMLAEILKAYPCP
jgi:ABC-type phosphate/phosphonate transport system substrate-binding protein